MIRRPKPKISVFQKWLPLAAALVISATILYTAWHYRQERNRALAGDLNSDGVIDVRDALLLAHKIEADQPVPDFNSDGVRDRRDAEEIVHRGVALGDKDPAGLSGAASAVYDLYLDPKGEPLAAWQAKIRGSKNTRITRVEGGEHIAFQQPPFYDSNALQKNTMIIAAFSTRPAEKLPGQRTRVASLHVQSEGTAPPTFELDLQAAANHKNELRQWTLQILKRSASSSD